MSGFRYAFVRYGKGVFADVYERVYREKDYRPRFDELPSEEEYKAAAIPTSNGLPPPIKPLAAK